MSSTDRSGFESEIEWWISAKVIFPESRRGTPHEIQPAGEPARIMLIATPAGMEKMIGDLGRTPGIDDRQRESPGDLVSRSNKISLWHHQRKRGEPKLASHGNQPDSPTRKTR